MIGRAALRSHFGLAPEAIDTDGAPSDETPWYVLMLVGAGAWISALLVMLFFGFLVWDILDDQPAALMVVGAVLLLGGGAVVRGAAPSSLFAGQLATAAGAAGAGLLALGAAITSDKAALAAATSTAIALAVAWLVPARIFQGLVTLLALCVIAAVAAEESDDLLPLVAAASTLLGTALLLLPPRRTVEPSAYVSLLFGPGLAAVVSWIPELASDPWSLVTAKALLVASLLAIFAGARRWGPALGGRILIVLPVVLMTAALAMPYGGAAALLALVVAYVRGAWSLATLGTLLLINATWRSYYDLSADLLAKSAAMAAVGLLLLALWVVLKPAEKAP